MRNGLIAILMLLPSASVSQDINIRTGEHTNFTRIAVDAPPRTEWKTETGSSVVVLSLKGDNIEYSLAGTTDRIFANRIGQISSEDNRLIVNLICECSSLIFQRTDGIIVIDISEKYDERRPKGENDGADQKNVGSSFTQRRGASDGQIAKDEIPDQPQDTETTTNKKKLVELRSELNTSISQAATKGLLTASLSPLLNPEPSNDVTVARIEASQIKQPNRKTNIENSRNEINFRIGENGQNEFLLGTVEYSYIDDSTPNCPSILISDWLEASSDTEFSFRISIIRNKIYQDLTDPDDDAILELATWYMSFGFYLEAKEVLELSLRPEATTTYLTGVLDIISGVKNGDNLFQNYLNCDIEMQLWAFLGQDLPADISTDYNLKPVFSALNSLPSRLQNDVAHLLKDQISEVAAPDDLQFLERIIKRNSHSAHRTYYDDGSSIGGAATNQIGATKAEFSQGASREVIAQSFLRDVFSRPPQKGAANESELQLASAFEKEFKGTALAQDISRARSRILTFLERYEEISQEISTCISENDGVYCRSFLEFIALQFIFGSQDHSFLATSFESPVFRELIAGQSLTTEFVARLASMQLDRSLASAIASSSYHFDRAIFAQLSETASTYGETEQRSPPMVVDLSEPNTQVDLRDGPINDLPTPYKSEIGDLLLLADSAMRYRNSVSSTLNQGLSPK